MPLLRLPALLQDDLIVLDAHRMEDAEAHLLSEDEEMRLRFDAERPATLEETRAVMTRWIDGRAIGHPMFAYALHAARRPDERQTGACRGARADSC